MLLMKDESAKGLKALIEADFKDLCYMVTIFSIFTFKPELKNRRPEPNENIKGKCSLCQKQIQRS